MTTTTAKTNYRTALNVYRAALRQGDDAAEKAGEEVLRAARMARVTRFDACCAMDAIADLYFSSRS